MSKKLELEMLMSNHGDVLGTLEFSQYVRQQMPKDSFIMSIDEAETIYQLPLTKHRELQHESPLIPMMVGMLINGVKFANEKRAGLTEGYKPIVPLAAFSASLLIEIYSQLELELPWHVPETFRVETPAGSQHRYDFYWKWTTFPADRIHNSCTGLLVDIIYSYLSEKDIGVVRTFDAEDVSDKGVSNGIVIKIPAKPSYSNSPIKTGQDLMVADSSEINFHRGILSEQSLEVKTSLFVARKYLQKYDDAARRGIEFTLTLSDMEMLLRKRVCHFTKEKLIINIGENYIQDDVIPDNYLTLDRLDPKQGYTIENTVVCSHRINQLKSNLTEEQFQHVISMHALTQSMGDKQIEALFAMLKK